MTSIILSTFLITILIVIHMSIALDVLLSYGMTGSKNKIQTRSFYSEFNTASKIACASACSHDHNKCKSFYLVKEINDHGKNAWRCSLNSKSVIPESIPQGNGIYGILYGIAVRGVQPPEQRIPNAEFNSIQDTSLGVSALFECVSGHELMKRVSLSFDVFSLKWPNMNQKCADTLCQQYRLSGTVLRNNDDTFSLGGKNGFTGISLCPDAQYLTDEVTCDEKGHWSLRASPQTDCVPTTCYRINDNGRAIYGGGVSKSTSDVTCKRWDKLIPLHYWETPVMFPVDNYNMSQAQNYCRDPDSTGFVWCFDSKDDTNLERWSKCDVHRCK